MNNIWTYFRIGLFILLIFIVTPTVHAEVHSGHAIFKDLVLEDGGSDKSVAEPMIIFEGKSYVPLRVIANSLGKNIYLDKQTNKIMIESTDQKNMMTNNLTSRPSNFRPELTVNEQVSSAGVILMEDNEEHIMYKKNGHSTFYPASTTKILTALLALEYGHLDDKVVVSEAVKNIPYDSSKAYINPGDEMTLEQLLYGLLLNSGNDCGVAIAVHIAGSEEAFAKLMNEKAKELGAKNSSFVNSHGYDHPNHYTTPYDLALILKEAANYPPFLEVLKTPSYKAIYSDKDGKQVTRYWSTTNDVFNNSSYQVDGIIGGKTGFTDLARHSLATVAEHNGHRYFVVTLKGNRSGRYIDTKQLLQQAYKARHDFDQNQVKKINVEYFTNSLVIDDQNYESEGQLFIYKGRTYVSQSYLKNILISVSQKQLGEKLVKLKVQSIQDKGEPVQSLNIAFAKTQLQPKADTDLLLHATQKMLGLANMKPVSLIVGTSIASGNPNYTRTKFH